MTQKDKAIRILLADDHTIFREGLRTLLSDRPEFRIVGEAGDGNVVCKLIDKLKPDILLLDLRMPTMSGMEVLQSLAGSKKKVRTILLSGAVEGEEISKAFELGANGVILKDTAAPLLFDCIHAVMEGQYWIGRQSFASLAEALKQHRNAAKKSSPGNFGLTPREIQIVKAVVSGNSNKEIAAALGISEQTVKHHITNIFDKLGVYNRLELTLFAFHHGLVEK